MEDENYKIPEEPDKKKRIEKIVGEGIKGDEEEEENEETKSFCVEDFENLLISTLKEGKDITEMIKGTFGDEVPIFSIDFIRTFVTYFEEKHENYRQILGILLNSNPTNVENLVDNGIIGKTLITECPESFEVFLDIFRKCPKEAAFDCFVNNSGCYQLAKYSEDASMHATIGELFDFVTHSKLIQYEMPLFPPMFGIDIFSSSELDDTKELYMENIMNNLLRSEDKDIVMKTLGTLKRLFKENTESLASLGFKFYMYYCKEPTDDEELNTMTIKVLTTAFKNGMKFFYKAGNDSFSQQFIHIRGIAESIIADEDSNDDLVSAAVKLVNSFLDARPSHLSALEIFEGTEIVPKMISRSTDSLLKAKKAISIAICNLIQNSKKSELAELVKLGVIGSLCDYAISNTDKTVLTVIEAIKVIVTCFVSGDLPEEEIEKMHEINEALEELSESECAEIQLKSVQLLTLIDKWFSEDEDD